MFQDGQTGVTNINGKVLKQGQQYYSKVGHWENLFNEKCVLMVNHEHQTVVYAPALAANNLSAWAGNPMDNFAAWKNLPKEWITDANGKKRIRMTHQEPALESTEVLLGEDGRLLALTYYYRATEESGPMRVEISYRNVSFEPDFSKASFSEKTFIQGSGPRAKLTPAFPNYKLLNQFSR